MNDIDPSAAPAEITPATEPAAPATEQPEPFDPESLSPEAKAYFKSQLESEKFKTRDTARRNAAEEARAEFAAQVAKALGLAEEDDVDPAELTGQIEHAQAQAWRSSVELEVYRSAGQLGANAEALLDSLKFIDSLDDLVDEDPRSPEFRQALQTKVQEALAGNPGYRAAAATPAAPRPDPSQGARGAGPDVDSRIAEAQAKGDWRTVISLQNEKLYKTAR